MAVIFDLDQTMVDSSSAAQLRRNGAWPRVYPLIRNFLVYDGMHDLIKLLHTHNVPMCVVTSSPESYCRRVIEFFGWNITNTVCWHDYKPNAKPHPDPMRMALQRMSVTANQAISIGDDPRDIQSSHAAGIFSVAATWGSVNHELLTASNPEAIAYSVDELRTILINRLPQLQPLRSIMH